MDTLERVEADLRHEAAKLLAAADAVLEVRTDKVYVTKVELTDPSKRRRRTTRARRPQHVPDPAGRESIKLPLGTGTGLEEGDLHNGRLELVHTSSS